MMEQAADVFCLEDGLLDGLGSHRTDNQLSDTRLSRQCKLSK